MLRRPWFYCLFLTFTLVLGLAVFHPAAASDPECPQARVRLAVVVVFDQFRGDYLERWEPLFAADGGFHRLKKEGAWYPDCHYPYATTVTGAGHATLSTGVPPSQHGIIDNEWYRYDNLAPVYSAANPERHRVPAPNNEATKEKATGYGSPENLLAPTIGEALKAAYQKDPVMPRVITLSLKDRSAVLLGGKNVDAAYWLDSATGTFVTSDYYRTTVHPWVKEFNDEKLIDTWFGKDWTPLQPKVDPKFVFPDTIGAAEGVKQGLSFPHPTTGGLDKPGPRYYDAVVCSPYGNELLLALAKKAIDAEKLGTRATPDLLMLSFSSNDLIGHAWGPDSPEVLDVTLRTDLIVKELLDYLDKMVGKDKYALVMSADHGICPLPEVTAARKKADPLLPIPDAQRLDGVKFYLAAETFLRQKFANGDDKVECIARRSSNSCYLNRNWIQAAGLKQEAVEQALANWAKKYPGILTTYTRTELLKNEPAPGDDVRQKVQLSFQPDRSGDVIFVTQPYWLVASAAYRTGTTHGTPHDYDTHVPLLIYGPGVKAGVRTEQVTPLATVPILAKTLGIAPPDNVKVPLPPKLFGQ
jgi:predicted AlkP superfamily pyrophosphatase or phosphodiesterase